VVNARTYAAKILGTIVVSNAAAVGFYFVRTRSMRNEVDESKEGA